MQTTQPFIDSKNQQEKAQLSCVDLYCTPHIKKLYIHLDFVHLLVLWTIVEINKFGRT